ncbi:hypothetical protein PQX77_000277 [Marasmius sp. AFHP31]|nr:hypothetical protein PQX77_000277 [Marasmius sp. AFHP31]
MDAHSYRPTAIRRDPSYRKPAPVYIPSPPSTPPRPSISMLPSSPVVSRAHSRPPLPHDWKVESEHAVVGDFALSESGTHRDRVEDARSECHDHPTSARKEGRIPPSPRSPRRGLPQNLKSPTPPLSAYNRKRKLPDVDLPARVSIPVIQASGSNRTTNVSDHVQAPERFPSRLEPLRYTPTVERPRHHRTPLTTQPSFKTEMSTVSTVSLVAPGSTVSGTLRSHGDDTPEEEWQVPVFSGHNPMHVVKIPTKCDMSRKPSKPQPQITRRGSMSCWDRLVLAIKDVLCHAFGGCFGASSR